MSDTALSDLAREWRRREKYLKRERGPFDQLGELRKCRQELEIALAEATELDEAHHYVYANGNLMPRTNSIHPDVITQCCRFVHRIANPT